MSRNRRSVLVMLGAAAVAGVARAQTNVSPDLAQRRAIQTYQEQTLPGLIAEIRRAAGSDVEVDVRWDRIAQAGQAEHYNDPDYWTNIYFRPLIAALQNVGRDEAGRGALRQRLRKVVVTYDAATAPASNYANGISFTPDGTLTVNFEPYANAADQAARTAALVGLLEASL